MREQPCAHGTTTASSTLKVLIKSALIARLAPGRRYGLDWSSAREPLRPFYHRTFRVSWNLHAVERNRQLAAQALGYALDIAAGLWNCDRPLTAACQ